MATLVNAVQVGNHSSERIFTVFLFSDMVVKVEALDNGSFFTDFSEIPVKSVEFETFESGILAARKWSRKRKNKVA